MLDIDHAHMSIAEQCERFTSQQSSNLSRDCGRVLIGHSLGAACAAAEVIANPKVPHAKFDKVQQILGFALHPWVSSCHMLLLQYRANLSVHQLSAIKTLFALAPPRASKP